MLLCGAGHTTELIQRDLITGKRCSGGRCGGGRRRGGGRPGWRGCGGRGLAHLFSCRGRAASTFMHAAASAASSMTSAESHGGLLDHVLHGAF